MCHDTGVHHGQIFNINQQNLGPTDEIKKKKKSQYHCHGSLSPLHKLQDLKGLLLYKNWLIYIEEAKSLVPDVFLLQLHHVLVG